MTSSLERSFLANQTPSIEAVAHARTVLSDLLLVHPATVTRFMPDYEREGEIHFHIAGTFDEYVVASYAFMAERWSWRYEDRTDEDGKPDTRALLTDMLLAYDNEAGLGAWRTGTHRTREDAASQAAAGAFDAMGEVNVYSPDNGGRSRIEGDLGKFQRGKDCLKDFANLQREWRRLADRSNPFVMPELYTGQFRHGELTLLKREGLTD
jgi:hypothetical protein